MTKKSSLRKACELAFEVARSDVEASPPIAPPQVMADYIDAKRLSQKALKTAEDAIDSDVQFRERVANEASENELGRAGFIWLVRPKGWKVEFEKLITEQAEESGVDIPKLDEVDSGGLSESDGNDSLYITGTPPKPPDDFGLLGVEDMDDTKTTDAPVGADSIKNELSSLRGLVDRLAGEREIVSAAAQDVEISKQERELESLRADLDWSRSKIDQLQSELGHVVDDSKRSKTKQSDALRRQVQLEKELTEARDLRSQLEGQVSELQVSVKELDDKLSRAEKSATEAEARAVDAIKEVEQLTQDRNTIIEEHAAMKIERDGATSKLEEIDRQAGGVDIGTLQRDNRDLAERAVASEAEISKVQARLVSTEKELEEEKEASAVLQAEKAEVSVRLSEAETAYEAAVASLETYKADSEKSVADLVEAHNQRDELTTQVDGLQTSLQEALDDLAKVREESDSDRASFRQMRSERDSLLARMSEIEQTEEDFVKKLEVITSERDSLLEKQETLITERGQFKGETAAAQREIEQLNGRVRLLQNKLEPLEAEVLAEKKRGEELAANLIEANRERAKQETDIKTLQEAQTQVDVNQPEFEEAGRAQDKLIEVESNHLVETQRYESELSELKAKLAESESTRERLAEQLFESTPSSDLETVENTSGQMDAIASPLGNGSNGNGVSNLVAPDYVGGNGNGAQFGLPSDAPDSALEFDNEQKANGIGSTVWDQDWPPKDPDFDSFDTPPKPPVDDSVYVADFPQQPKANNEVDIDEISELLSRTVTDFQAIEEGPNDSGFNPTVYDPTSGNWNSVSRKQVTIPAGIAPNSIDALQHAVGVQEVVLLVDGDAVASLGWSKLPVVEQRSSLVSFLAHISEQFGAAPQVVFDGHLAGQDSLPASRLVRIRLSSPPLGTVSVIEELVHNFPEQWPIVIITDDSNLTQASEAQGITVFKNEQLLDFINLLANS